MKALMIEEIKQLNKGDWVWIVTIQDEYRPNDISYGEYYKVSTSINHYYLEVSSSGSSNYYEFLYENYGKTWVAYKNKEQAECKEDLYKTAFELILEDVYENRLQADTLSCSSCPFMFEFFDECQNQGLYDDCKTRWKEYYLEQAEQKLKELRGKV